MGIITLTKQGPISSPTSAPDLGAGEPAQVEVTPEMVEAGISVLWASGAVEGELGSDKLLVAEIYRAMASLGPCGGRLGDG